MTTGNVTVATQGAQTQPQQAPAQPQEEAATQGAGAQHYGGPIPAVAPLRDRATPPPSASERAYDEIAAAPEDDAQNSSSGRSSGPGGTRFAHDASLGDVESGARRFRLGDTGLSVRKIQQALSELGYRPIEINSTYDQVTVDRVTEYQAKNKVGNGKGELDSATFKVIEQQLDVASYAHAATTAPPGIHDTPKNTNAKDVPVLLTGTTLLDADAKAEANAVLTPGHTNTTPKPFIKIGYEAELEKNLTETIDYHSQIAHARKKQHGWLGEKFSMKDLAKVGNASKGAVDKVFGSWTTGDAMKAGVNLVDRFDSDTAKQDKESKAEKKDDAKHRARYFMNTESVFTTLDQDHHVDRERTEEKDIISRVIERVATARQADLLLITATWSASTDSKTGQIHIQRLADKDGNESGNRDRLWDKFGTLIHEYIHSLAHKNWKEFKAHKTGQAAHTLTEGVTELLTHIVISQVNTADPKLRAQVLQGVSDDGSEPDLSRGDSYTDARVRAETLVGVVGIDNLYAAYFLGATELVGA